MLSIDRKQSSFKSAHEVSKLSPNYLYEIDLMSKTTNWMSQSGNKNSIAITNKHMCGR